MARRKEGIDVRPAPGDLRLVQAFVNTHDLEAKTDRLASPQALADWLTLHGLMAAGTRLEAADVARTARLREGLRSMLGAGVAAGSQAAKALDDAMSTVWLRPRAGGGRELILEPAARGLDGALGRLTAIVAAAQQDGSWLLLKVCANPTCRAVFYDYSTNHSGRWCRSRCGSRISTAAHRRRRRRAGLKAW